MVPAKVFALGTSRARDGGGRRAEEAPAAGSGAEAGGGGCWGRRSGYRAHQRSPSSACASVALLAQDRSWPVKMSGGGG